MNLSNFNMRLLILLDHIYWMYFLFMRKIKNDYLYFKIIIMYYFVSNFIDFPRVLYGFASTPKHTIDITIDAAFWSASDQPKSLRSFHRYLLSKYSEMSHINEWCFFLGTKKYNKLILVHFHNDHTFTVDGQNVGLNDFDFIERAKYFAKQKIA